MNILYQFLVLFFVLGGCYQEKEEENIERTKLHFKEVANVQIVQDRYKAVLRYEVRGEKSDEVQGQLNQMMEKGTNVAKGKSEVEVSTARYNVRKNWDGKLRKYSGWTAYQELILDTENKEEISDIVGELQKEGFLVSNFNAYLSKDKKAEYRNQLIKEALSRVKIRADLVASEMGKDSAKITEINIDSNRFPSPGPRVYHSRISEMSLKAPTIEESKQNISVTISVVVVLE